MADLPTRGRRNRLGRQKHWDIDSQRRCMAAERLEERTLLAVNIPPLTSADPVQQIILAPDTGSFEIAALAGRRFYRFSVDDGPAAATTATFQTTTSTFTDAALVLYDADGNVLQVADDDSDPGSFGNERLVAHLDPLHEYILGIVGTPQQPSAITVTTALDNSAPNGPIAIDPSTGVPVHSSEMEDGILSGRTDIDYYPLGLFNAATGSVTVTPISPDMDPFVSLFRRQDAASAWRPLATGQANVPGDPVTLLLSPLPGANLTDAEYMLGITPAQLASAGGAYEIAVSAATLGPASVTPPLPDAFAMPALVNPGQLELDMSATVSPSAPALHAFRAPQEGVAHVRLLESAVAPIVSVYNDSGTTLLHVMSRTEPISPNVVPSVEFELPVQEGAGYIVRVGSLDGGTGDVRASLEMSYTATSIELVEPVETLGLVPGSGGVAFFQLETRPGDDVLVVDVSSSLPNSPNAAAAIVTVVGESFSAVSRSAPAGQSIVLPIDISQYPGPFDLMIAITAGSEPLTVNVGRVDVPRQLELDALAGAALNLAGELAVNQPAGSFGQMGGIAYYNLVTQESERDTFITAHAAEAMPLLAVFEEYGGKFRLLEWKLPDASGTAALERELNQNRHHAVAVLPLMPSSSGSLSITIDAPHQTGVGVAMAPEPPPLFPGDPEHPFDPSQPFGGDMGPWSSELNVRTVVLENAYHEHLWRTVLPLNMLEKIPETQAATSLYLEIEPEGFLGATLDVIRPDGTADGQLLASLTTINGNKQTASIPFSPDLQGATLLFRVRSLPDQLDDGIYTLHMSVRTTNPHPFEVLERFWELEGSTVHSLADPYTDFRPTDSNPVAAPLRATPTVSSATRDVIQDQFGEGAIESTFAPSAESSTYQLDVFRFKAVGAGELRVWTERVDDHVNTNLRVYRAESVSVVVGDLNINRRYLVPLNVAANAVGSETVEVLPNFDWFPADRSEIDAQTLLREQSDFGVADDQWYYVVVKNQEGSAGRYRLHVDSPSAPARTPAITSGVVESVKSLPPRAEGPASATFVLADLHHDFETVRYVPVRVPDYHGRSLTVTSAVGHGLWDISLFDRQGNELRGTTTDLGGSTSGTFDVPPGPQSVFARIKERNVAANRTSAQFFVSATLMPPTMNTLVSPPPVQLPAIAPTYLDISPWGDGQGTGSLALGGERVFQFQAAARPMKIELRPALPNPRPFLWGVYIDGQLAAWDLTRFGEETPAVVRDGLIEESLWTKIFTHLPEFDLAADGGVSITTPEAAEHRESERLAERNYAYDRGSEHDISIYVFGLNPVAGSFTITVESAAEKPLRDFELTISPLDGTSLLTPRGVVASAYLAADAIVPAEVTRRDWTRLYVPDGAGPVTLTLGRPVFQGGVTVRYWIYDSDGVELDSGNAFVPFAPPSAVQVPLPSDKVIGGRSYYVNVGVMGDPGAAVRLSASAAVPSNPSAPEDTTGVPDAFPQLFYMDPDGDGSIESGSGPFFSFWVGAPGPVSITGLRTSGSGSFDIELYRFFVDNSELGPIYRLVLIDYADKLAVPLVTRTLAAELDPGAYAVRVRRTSRADSDVQVLLDTPTPVIDDIVLDPNFGLSNLPGLTLNDTAVAGLPTGTNLVESFRTAFYRVQAPSGALGEGSAEAEALDVGDPTTSQDGSASLAWWRSDDQGDFQMRVNLTQFVIDPAFVNGNLTGHQAKTGGPTAAIAPGEVIYVNLIRRRLANSIKLHAAILVPTSGTPDLIVQPIHLSPNQGETRVDITVTNVGYAPAASNASHFRIRDTSKSPAVQWTTSEMLTSTLGPFGSSVRVLAWDPVETSDQVSFEADVLDTIEEISETNNFQLRTLSEVNKHKPTVTAFELKDPLMDGTGPNVDPNGEVWGRYISGVHSTTLAYRLTVEDDDGGDDVYRSFVDRPKYGLQQFGSAPVNEASLDAGNLAPTSADNPNEFVAYVRDIWGLESERVIRTAMVERRPRWLENPPGKLIGAIRFDKPSHSYQISFHNKLFDYNETLNSLLPFDIPLIGTKENRFLVEFGIETSASLDPSQSIVTAVESHALLRVLGNTVFDVTYDGTSPITNNVGLVTSVSISPQTLEASALYVGLKIVDLPLIDYTSPEIRLFSFGIPGIASLNANLLVSFLAQLDAGITLAFDADALSDPTRINPLGFARPTFVGLDLNPSLTIEGEAELLGFLDIASISGTIGLNLDISVGLLNNAPLTDIVAFDDLFSNFGVELNGSISLGTSFEVLGIEVWDYHWQSPPLISVGSDVVTWSEVNPSQLAQGNAAAAVPIQPVTPPPPLPDPATGSSPVGQLKTLPRPNLLLDSSGGGLFLQAVDTGNGLANLAYALRSNGAWDSSLAPLGQSEHVLNPTAALTHDGAGMPAVVVYQATAIDPTAPGTTVDQFLNAQELRWRYFDGQSWAPEMPLESNGRFDGDPSVAFNSMGDGLVAWTRNTSGSPLRDPSGNEIVAALWDSASHAWLPPVAITNDVVGSLHSDSQPAAHVTADGTPVVVWLRNTSGDPASQSAAGTSVWFSRYEMGAWSAPALLPVSGLLPDGRISQLAIGSSGDDGNGRERVDVLIAQSQVVDADGDPSTAEDRVANSRLFHRTAWADSLADPAGVQTVTEGVNVSYLRTLPHPDGGLLAYWQQSDGRTNDVFASHLGAPGPGGSTWSAPMQLTTGDALEVAPALAIDIGPSQGGGGQPNEPVLQLVFDQKAPLFSGMTLPPPAADSSDGIPMAGHLNADRLPLLPELGFARPLTFPARQLATIGHDVTAEATIVNRGLVATTVHIEYLRVDDANVLGTQTVVVGPGRSVDIAHSIPVIAGPQTIQVQLTSLDHGGLEMIGTDDNVSADSLFGAPDLVVTSVEIHPPHAAAGEPVSVEVTIANTSTRAIAEPFVIALYSGNPFAPLGSGVALAEQVVASFPPSHSQTLTFTWTIPDRPADHVLTAVIDSEHRIGESSEFNNSAWAHFQVEADAQVASVTATLLDHSGVDNVLVEALIRNPGRASLQNVDVHLFWSRNDGSFQPIDSMQIAQLVANDDGTAVQFLAPGWAGMNAYRVAVDLNSTLSDSNRSNNSGRAHLAVQGLADLTLGALSASVPSPVQGQPLDLVVELRNEGIDDADDIRIEVLAVSAQFGRRVVSRIEVEHLDPLSSTTVTLPIDTSHLAGDITLIVLVDRLEKILELSDLNNQAQIGLKFTPSLNIDSISSLIKSSTYDPLYDFDSDSDVDDTDLTHFVSQVLGTTFGDANLDRIFNSSDLVQVLQLGEYEDGIAGNSTWAEGDWNADGDFDSGDLVRALQAGGYSHAARDVDGGLEALAVAILDWYDKRRRSNDPRAVDQAVALFDLPSPGAAKRAIGRPSDAAPRQASAERI